MKSIATFLVVLALLVHVFTGTVRAEERNLSAVASKWNHNGSIMGLIVEGNQRTIVYVRPRAGLENLVRPGTVLFTGISTGNSYKGTARRFMPGLPPANYTVIGPITKSGSQVILRGMAPIRDAGGNVTKMVDDVLVFDLISAK